LNGNDCIIDPDIFHKFPCHQLNLLNSLFNNSVIGSSLLYSVVFEDGANYVAILDVRETTLLAVLEGVSDRTNGLTFPRVDEAVRGIGKLHGFVDFVAGGTVD
jgi:hypothetical protein